MGGRDKERKQGIRRNDSCISKCKKDEPIELTTSEALAETRKMGGDIKWNGEKAKR